MVGAVVKLYQGLYTMCCICVVPGLIFIGSDNSLDVATPIKKFSIRI